jgi:hypothetical protein
MTAERDPDAKTGPDAARLAARRLRSFAEGAPIDEEAPELSRLADLAASYIVGASQNTYTPEQRKQLADNVLAALTLMRVGRLMGSDPEAIEAAKARVLKFAEIFEMAIELQSE